jgi:hypothetical protein
LVRERLLQEHFLQEYEATWARHAINFKSVPHINDDFWSFVMLPDAQPVSGVFFCLRVLILYFRVS